MNTSQILKKVEAGICDLRESACILSLIAENSAKMIKNESFLKDSFEVLINEVKRIRKVISLVESVIDARTFELKELKGTVEKLAPPPNTNEYELKKYAKMKLEATYEKEANAFIKASLKVIDSGDFPTANIFNSASENPSDEAWSLGEGKQSTISENLPSSDEAKQWVLSQVRALREKLDHWRNIIVPESEEFEV